MDRIESRALARRESVPGHPDWTFGKGSPSSPEEAPIDVEFQIVRVGTVVESEVDESADSPTAPTSDTPTTPAPPYRKGGKLASLVVFLVLVGLVLVGVLLIAGDLSKDAMSNGHLGKLLTAFASVLVGTIIIMVVRLVFFGKQQRDLEPPSQKRLDHIKSRMSRTKEWIQDNRDTPLMYPVYFLAAWWLVVWTSYIFSERPGSPWTFLEKNWGLTWISPLIVLVAIYFVLVSSKVIKAMGWATVAVVGVMWLGAVFSNIRFADIGLSGDKRGPAVHQLVTGLNSFTVTKDRWETFIVPAYHNIAYEALGPVKFKRKTTRGKVEEYELVGGVRIPPAINADGSPAEVSSIAFKAIAEPTQVEIKASQTGGRRSTPESNNSHIVFEGG